jgi:hypothetical protein
MAQIRIGEAKKHLVMRKPDNWIIKKKFKVEYCRTRSKP